ncbi:MAG: helix-turn-helix transcriptional regulator [Brevibacterium sp.]|nr:helix-turn-helix transcriptional regulator [Brevibacterium sp.]MDN6747883.1 helix-turn-helix transcriptional regulator [Brevibacterium sp.]
MDGEQIELRDRDDEGDQGAEGVPGGEGGGYAPLTSQEMSVADLVVRGMTDAEVSRKLVIAKKTVQYHLTHIYGKFGIRSRTELAAGHLSGEVLSV